MSEARKPWGRRLAGVVLVLAAVALGWYAGSRVGEEPPSADRAAQRGANGEVHRDIAGRVVRVAPEAGESGVITVDHEAIEGFMPAMVMDLQVVEPAELDGLEPDDAIVFDLARIGEVYKAVHIRRVVDDSGEGGAAAPAPAFAPSADRLGRGDLVPDLVLIDAAGERIRLREMQPRHKLITFFYVRCPLQDFCPAQSQRLAELQRHIEETGSELHLVSLTLDAEHDNADVLAGYAERFDADPARWTLAGGEDPEAIRRFADRAGARIEVHAGSFEIDHALIALRVDGDRIVDFVYGLDAMTNLVRGM